MQQKYLTFHVHLSPVFRNVVHRFPCIFKRFDQSLYERTLIQFANIPTCIFLLTLQHPDNFLDQTHFWRIQILAFFPCCKKASVVHNEHLSVIFQALVCSKNSRTLLLALSNAKKNVPPFCPIIGYTLVPNDGTPFNPRDTIVRLWYRNSDPHGAETRHTLGQLCVASLRFSQPVRYRDGPCKSTKQFNCLLCYYYRPGVYIWEELFPKYCDLEIYFRETYKYICF